MHIKYLLLLPLALLFVACSESSSSVPVEIHRFDKAESSFTSMPPSERDSIIALYLPEVQFLQQLYDMPTPDSAMLAASSSRSVQVFSPDVNRYLTSLSPVQEQIGLLLNRLPDLLPDIAFPSRFSTIILPYKQSIVISDTLLLIGVNHYLGPEYEGYASFDSYTRAQKSPHLLPYHIAEAVIRSAYPLTESEATTTLSRLLYEGAVIHTLTQLFPDADPAEIMGYSAQQLASLRANETTLWQRIIAQNLLYSIDPMVAARLTEPAASTAIISSDAPPRAGRYLGWRIIQAYIKGHPSIPLSTLLSPQFYSSPNTLKEAKYTPSS